jgi:hypothetical protein
LVLAGACVLAPAFAACSWHEEGITVELAVARGAAPGLGGGAGDAGAPAAEVSRRTLVTDLDEVVDLEHAYAVLSRVELVPCATVSARPWLRELIGPSVAYAHDASASTVWTASTVLDLLEPTGGASPIAVLRPPPGDYCAVRITLDRAEAAAQNLPADVAMIGKSIALEGTFTGAAGGVAQPFRYVTATPARADVTFVDRQGRARSLSLSADHLRARVRLELGYAPMFDGVAMVAGEYEPNAAFAIENLAGRARAVAQRD